MPSKRFTRGIRSESEQARLDKSADARLRWRFGILPEAKGGPHDFAGIAEYERRLGEQGGKCAICRCAPDPRRRFAVDHNHSSGKIRGLLCTVCNARVLGRLERFKKRISLEMIQKYLEKFDPENVLLRKD